MVPRLIILIAEESVAFIKTVWGPRQSFQAKPALNALNDGSEAYIEGVGGQDCAWSGP